MFFNLLWLIPACLFLISYLIEPRRLINAYLLSISLFFFSLVMAGFLVIGVEAAVGVETSLTVMALLALFVPVGILFSTIYLLFNGKQMIVLEGPHVMNLLSLFYGMGILATLILYLNPNFFFSEPFVFLAAMLLIYVTFLYLSYIIYGFWCNLFPLIKEPDIIIILGSGLIGNKVPPLLAQRLDKGKEIYEKFGRRPQLIVSGGKGPDERLSEAEAMAAYLIERELPQDRIWLENQSRTTYENLAYSQKLIESHQLKAPLVLSVTNSFHTLRASIYMRQLKIKGNSIGSRTIFYYLLSAWLRETAGLIVIYWKWHAAFLLLLFIPYLLSLMK